MLCLCLIYIFRRKKDDCSARAKVFDGEDGVLYTMHPHSHDADHQAAEVLRLRSKVLDASTSSTSMVATFNDTVRGSAVASQLTFPGLSAAMYRQRSRTFPPIPANADAAAASFEQRMDAPFSKFYQGKVGSEEVGHAIIFANPESLAALEGTTTTAQADGTFRSTPAGFYQLLALFFTYK